MVRGITGAIALACAAAALAGCATIVHGTTEQVQIGSTPGGAEVEIDDSQQRVTTPAAVKLSRRDAHKLVFHKPGYQDATANLTSGISGWIVGNLIAGGVVGMAIDASDGAAHSLSTDEVNVTLTPLPAPPSTNAAGVPARNAQAETPPDDAQATALVRDPQPALKPVPPAGAATPPEGPPPEDFSDDGAGYVRPQAPPRQ